eukprot:1264843-Pyramimonas_sp.AAC.1
MPRSLGQSGAYAEPILPTHSIVQGLRGGTRFARCLTYFILSRVTVARPAMGTRIWVGDLSQRVRGSRRAIRLSL